MKKGMLLGEEWSGYTPPFLICKEAKNWLCSQLTSQVFNQTDTILGEKKKNFTPRIPQSPNNELLTPHASRKGPYSYL